ncbi:hypothetical protein RI129_012473 [Pyrocoelia pectoralis]|uniref:Circadian clock-controlled protein n=1 Tax=Pyrocoelia pectoralis TaxID=417401 RepID=A0AAN7V278_9COLE
MKVLTILSVLVLKALSKNLPSSFMVCDHFGSNVNECLTEAINSALVQLRNGIPEIDIPSIEPMRPGSNITVRKNDAIISLHDVHMYNLSNAVVTDLKSNITRESFWLAANFSATDFTAIANYSVHGQLLFFHLDGGGKGIIDFKDTILQASMEGIVVNNRFRLNKFAVKVLPKLVIYDLQNIIRDQKKFSDDVNKVFNDSWDVLFYELEPELEELLSSIWLNYANVVLSYVPVSDK